MSINTKNWYAWLNAMPPPPDDLHVIGKVLVANPGIEAILCERHPPGINPTILLLDLFLVQRPGPWPDVQTWTTCRYEEIYFDDDIRPSEVIVYFNGSEIQKIPVQIIT